MNGTMTRPWHEIVERYSGFNGDNRSIHALHDLALRIADSPYRNGFFAWTSMWDLCIAQTEVSYPYDGPFLRISPISDDRVELRFIDTRDRCRQWHREVPAEEAYDRLEKFLVRDLKWCAPLPTSTAS